MNAFFRMLFGQPEPAPQFTAREHHPEEPQKPWEMELHDLTVAFKTKHGEFVREFITQGVYWDGLLGGGRFRVEVIGSRIDFEQFVATWKQKGFQFFEDRMIPFDSEMTANITRKTRWMHFDEANPFGIPCEKPADQK